MRLAPGLVERRFIKISDARDVHLPLLAQHHGRRVVDTVDDHRGVPYGVRILRVSLQDAINDDQFVLGGEIEAQLGRNPLLGGFFCELAPFLFAGAERKRHRPALLGTKNLAAARGRDLGRAGHARVEGLELLGEGRVGRGGDGVLREREPDQPGSAELLGRSGELERREPEVGGRGRRGGLRGKREVLDGVTAVDPVEDALGLGEGVGGEVALGFFFEGGRARGER